MGVVDGRFLVLAIACEEHLVEESTFPARFHEHDEVPSQLWKRADHSNTLFTFGHHYLRSQRCRRLALSELCLG